MGLHAFGYTFTAAEFEYYMRTHNGFIPYLKEYARICGITCIDKSFGFNIPNSFRDSKSFVSFHLFRLPYSIWIYVGTLDIYISADFTGDVNFELTIISDLELQALAGVGPTLTVTGGASATVLVIIFMHAQSGVYTNYQEPMKKIIAMFFHGLLQLPYIVHIINLHECSGGGL